MSREWPEVLDEMIGLLNEREEQEEEARAAISRENLLKAARRQFGTR